MVSDKPIVLITGSEGTLGSAISAALAGTFTVVGFARECHGSAACITADITSDQALVNACAQLRERYGDRIASVIHLAAFFAFSGESDPRYDEVNVRGTQKLIQALQSFKVEQFVYASTMLVHVPSQPGVPISEDWPIGPTWPYPQSKAAAETIVRTASGAMPVVILRMAGVYTDHCQVPSLASQIQRIYERQMLSHVFPGDAAHGQSFLSLSDLTQAFRRVVERRTQLPRESTILIGEPVTESYEALQNLFGRLIHGETWETTSIPKTVAAAGAWLQNTAEDVIPDAIDRGVEPFIKPFMVDLADDHYELDISRAQALLGWQPAHTLRQTLPRMIESLKHNPAQWYKLNKISPPPWVEHAHDAAAPGAKPIQEARALERREHQQTLWCHFTNAALGLWLATSPFIFGFADGWMVTGELIAPNQRGLELSDTWMTASDVVTGVLITIFGLLSLWYLFFHGGTMSSGGSDRSDDFEAGFGHVLREMLQGGVTLPWTLMASVTIGAALMLTRLLFDASGSAANNDHIVGALVITISIIALAEVARPVRFLNIALGLWLVVAPWLLAGYSTASSIASVVAGALLILLARPRGPIRNHYGAWDRCIGTAPKIAR